SAPEQLSSENETFERQNLKSILKKLSASSRAGSSETSATSTSDHEAETVELKKLMRKPTVEGYSARHSKSVTFNKCTLQSPPSEQPLQPPSNYPLSSIHNMPLHNKFSFRPVSSASSVLSRTENIQSKFELQFMSLELEILKHDEIIEMERRKADDFGGDSTEPDAFMEEDLDDDRETHPFMRDSSVDTVLRSVQSRDRHSISSMKASCSVLSPPKSSAFLRFIS
ncbi:hypothetical protein ALC60_02327, partial [Trachymyrmex zeteki]